MSVEVGNVYKAKGGRPGWRGGTRYWLVATVSGNTIHLLGLNAEGDIVSTTSYGIHVLEARELVGHISPTITLGGKIDLKPVMLGQKIEWVDPLADAVRKMAEAEKRYGCGFYGDPAWNEAYDSAVGLAGASRWIGDA